MIKTNIKNIEILRFKIFQDKGLLDFSTTTHGGVSEGNYDSLNLGNFTDDDIEKVKKNREIFCEAINITTDRLFIPKQTHESNSLIIDKSFLSRPGSEQNKLLQGIDALITQQRDIAIAVTTADCVPLLIFDTENKVLATVHAGWKGTLAKIANKTIAKMVATFGSVPQNMIVGIAPSISPKMFEVGDEVGEKFKEEGFGMDRISFRNPNTGKLHIDLWTTNQISLINSGIPIQNIEIAKICTFSNPNMFFSARRQTIHSGRMLTGGIILK